MDNVRKLSIRWIALSALSYNWPHIKATVTLMKTGKSS